MYRQLLKQILVSLLTLLVSNFCFGQLEYYHTLKSRNVKGDVDSIVQNQYLILNHDSIAPPINGKTVSIYNKKGFIVEDRYYNYVNDLDFDKKIYSRKPTNASRVIRNYSDKGVLAEQFGYDSNGDLNNKDVYAIDPATAMIEDKHHYLPTQSLTAITKLQLDKKGNIVDAVRYDPNGNIVYKQRYMYDDRHNCIENININVETLKEYKTKFTYSYGDMVTEVHYNDIGEVQTTHTYRYTKYDEKHNWLVQKVYLNGRFCRLEERTIVYRK